VATTGKTLISPMLGKAGDRGARDRASAIRSCRTTPLSASLGLSVHLEALERVLASIPLPPGSVVTLTDAESVVVARSLDAAQYVGRSAAPAGARAIRLKCPRRRFSPAVDGVERVFGNAVVERGPWLASVGIPTRVAMSRTMPIFQRNFGIAIAATRVIRA
jgi:hypothetical protein